MLMTIRVGIINVLSTVLFGYHHRHRRVQHCLFGVSVHWLRASSWSFVMMAEQIYIYRIAISRSHNTPKEPLKFVCSPRPKHMDNNKIVDIWFWLRPINETNGKMKILSFVSGLVGFQAHCFSIFLVCLLFVCLLACCTARRRLDV